MWTGTRRAVRWLGACFAALVILVAIGIGAFRMFAAQLPTYKQDVQSWAQAELGLHVDYEALDLRLTLGGPELLFYGARLATSEADEQFVLARSANITLDIIDLIFDRAFTPTRLTFEGIEITVERTLTDELRIEGVPSSQSVAPSFDFEIPRSVALAIRESRLTYDDHRLGIAWTFEDIAVTVEQNGDSVEMSLTATPPSALASRIELSIDGEIDSTERETDDWRAFAALRDADLATLTSLAPDVALAGHGDVSIWLEMRSGELTSALTDLALVDVSVAGPIAARYDRLALTSEWSRSDRGWSLAFNDVVLSRAGVDWPSRGNTVLEWSTDEGLSALRTDYVRLEDLTPIVAHLPMPELTDAWLRAAPRGEISDFAFVTDRAQPDAFEISSDFAGIGFDAIGNVPALGGLSGALRADARGGTIRLDSTRATIDAPDLFGRELIVGDLTGLVLWRRGRGADRLVTDDLELEFLGAPVAASLELSVPRDGGSARLDLDARIGAIDVAAVKPYIVAAQPRDVVASWLDGALGGGRVEQARATFFGPLDAFPFDRGEGQFRVVADISNGTLDYVRDWPRVEDFDGEIEFFNAGFAARGSARVLGNVSDDVEVTIADMRAPMLTVEANTVGPFSDVLRFLIEAPPIARYLGPGYSQLSAPAGTANVYLDLRVPLPVTADYELEAELDISDGALAFEGFGPEARDINGSLQLREGAVTGEAISASFLEGPISIDVAVPERADYRAEILVDGEVSAAAALAAFDLPYRDRLAGQTRWRGRLSLPDVAAAGDEFASPVLVEVDANLSGVALRFPEPFAKAPREVTNLRLAFAFGGGGDLNVTGNLGASRHFVGTFAKRGDRVELLQGQVSFGEARAEPLSPAGLDIVGTLTRLDLDAWRGLLESTEIAPSPNLLHAVNLEIADFEAYGQALGQTRLDLAFEPTQIELAIESDPIAGSATIPLGARGRGTITAEMSRLQLQTGRATGLGAVDPRELPGIDIVAADSRIGPRRLGRLEAHVEPDPLGLRLTSFSSETAEFRAEGSGSWLARSGGSETRLAFSLSSTDVAATLVDFGFDPVIEGQAAELTASLHWPGGPSPDWMNHLSGDIALRVNDGSLLDIEPGAGRIVGLMSIVALPRRLALDFRDVFNRGFAFDEITADFELVDGNAYTDNLMLSGPAAEIGVVGRTGLRDRDFQQQAVVTAEPSNMLPTVGAVFGGPTVGAALLIFTRIFKKPLRGLGRVSYCIEGSWEEPQVGRLTDEQLESNELCAELPPEWANELLVEGAQ